MLSDDFIAKVTKTLNERQLQVMVYRLGINQRLRNRSFIAKLMTLSHERVRQIEENSIRILLEFHPEIRDELIHVYTDLHKKIPASVKRLLVKDRSNPTDFELCKL